jgi:hypothetical protein
MPESIACGHDSKFTACCLLRLAIDLQWFEPMRNVCFLFLGLFMPLTAAQADYIIKQKMENAGSNQEITLKIKESKCRVDANAQTTAIIDSKTGETTILIHPNKTFMKLTSEQLQAQGKAMKELLQDQANRPPDAPIAPSGQTEIINGMETEGYTATLDGMIVTFSIAKNYPNYQKIVTAMYNVQSGPGMDGFRSLSLPPDQYPGMPIRTQVEMMGQKVTTTLESAEETSIPDSEFDTPADYKELKPPETPSATATPGK